MSVKGRICLVFLLVLVSATVSFGRSETNPEVNECKQKCEQFGSGGDVEIVCKKQCEWYGPENHNIVFTHGEQVSPKIVELCNRRCQSPGERPNPECIETCIQKIEEQFGRKSGDTSRTQKTRKSRKQDRSNNPYVFQDHHFTTRLETGQGNFRILQKFTDRSDLFRGIENYRVAFLEVEPQTFVIPNHWDANALFFVANGEGTISLINQDSRQSHNIRRGDIFHVPAGITAYLINTHNNERLVLVKILRSISVPGELQNFFSVGGDNPESSFFDAFSPEYLEAAFDVDQESLDRLFGQQQQQKQQGIFKKATEEQIRSLTGKDEGGSIWSIREKKQQRGPYNIFKNEPSVANENGNLHVVDLNDLKDLRDIGVAFSFFNITQGSMAGPLYNAKSTVILVIPNGEGRFEMACPHLAEQTTGIRGGVSSGYQKVSSDLRRGTVVVVPAGHPIVIEATGNQDLEVVSFGINSDVSELWFPLAGRDGVISQWEDEAIELTFGEPASEVKPVIQKQKQRFFFKAPARSGRDLML